MTSDEAKGVRLGAVVAVLAIAFAAPFHYYIQRADESLAFVILAAAALVMAVAMVASMLLGGRRLMHVAAGGAVIYWAAQMLAVLVAPALGASGFTDRFAFMVSNLPELAVAFVAWRMTGDPKKRPRVWTVWFCQRWGHCWPLRRMGCSELELV